MFLNIWGGDTHYFIKNYEQNITKDSPNFYCNYCFADNLLDLFDSGQRDQRKNQFFLGFANSINSRNFYFSQRLHSEYVAIDYGEGHSRNAQREENVANWFRKTHNYI